MCSQVTVCALLILSLTLNLPARTQGQFWKSSINQNESWRREMLANRDSGICYRNEFAKTLDPELTQRQISYCCDGYVNQGTPKILKCEPLCEGNCHNGVCLSPGNCECEPGYYREDAYCRRYGE